MRLCELLIKNFYCIDSVGIRVKIDNIIVLIGPNNVGKTTVLKAYELFTKSGEPQPIESFYQNKEENAIEITGIFSDISDEDKKQIGEKWLYTDSEYGDVIKYKWRWNKVNEKAKKQSWNEAEKKWESGGMGGWDSKIASCLPTPLKINPFDDAASLEKQIVDILTTAVKESIKSDNSKLSGMIDQMNTLANEVKSEINEELSKTTSKLQDNIGDIFPEHKIDLMPQAGKIDVDKILASGTHIRVADSLGTFYPLINQGSGLQRAFLWSAIEALADTGNYKSGKKVLSSNEPRILLVEEPESFLHPPAIRAAREALYKIADLENWQVMITTHSPIFIDVSKPHTTIVRVEKQCDSSTKIFSTDKADFDEDERERLQMIRNCHPTINEFFFSDKIILVEGDTEQSTLSELKGNTDITIVNCRGKANIPMFQKILNHFGLSYTVVHDLDSPRVKRKEKWITNAMWSINNKIVDEANKKDGNLVIVNVPDFEGQFFGYLQKGDKPYNAVKELAKQEKEEVRAELNEILTNTLAGDFSRIINLKEQYRKLAQEYAVVQSDEKEAWEFDD
ncbi:ATP-dependent endonuclease of the OLD family-like protein [Desulfitobacterium hafniense DCB-2]|uniref:ATP-dependent endonuclease of the OLD family-like protein n=1 Tax=Desulfitobacterium hafniense (strain DSM 10664 / DCB-2) TaxID=272564 RepID=B8FVQ2_DESHD|nr:AAA family ATPase [Desulfitobacterium hafniense]ACL22454.1 ATP-dependent endonuclease of the OLD family-like protein [Desulfitobacterium hafniense DCB-2]